MNTYRIKIRIKGEKVDPRTSWTDHIDILVRSHTDPDISVHKVKLCDLSLEPEDLNKGR